MATDASRRELYVALEAAIGRRPADTMMELLPPVGWADVARQSDMVGVRGEIAEVRGEIAEVRGEIAEVRGEIANLRAELKGDIASLRTELKGDIADLRAEMQNLLPRLYRANFAGAVALSGLVLAAAKLA